MKNNNELYLILYDTKTNKQFKKTFSCEWNMDKFIRKLHYSEKLYIIKDSREEFLSNEKW